MVALEVKSLTKLYKMSQGYETIALDGLDMTVAPGEFVGIMGPSGSGKTTLLNLIGTLDTVTSGAIIIDGRDVTKLRGDGLVQFRKAQLGFVFQDFNLLDSLTIEENIILPLLICDSAKTSAKEQVYEMAGVFGIGDILGKYPYQVSGGQKQRAATARALVKSPALLLADEPSGNLDYRSARNLLEYFAAVNQQFQITIVMVTHDPAMASYCHRVLFLKDGKIVNQLVKGQNQGDFYHEVMEAIMKLEGARNELSTPAI